MIRRKTRMGILLLAALVAASYWAGREQLDRQQAPSPGLDTQLDYALQDFELKFFDREGQLSIRLTAPELANHATSGVGEISKPVFNVVHGGNVWKIVAESAIVQADREHITLTGDVWMRRHQPDDTSMVEGGILDIHTSMLMLDVTPRIAFSDQPVRVVDGNDIMEAVGFRVNMINDKFQLLFVYLAKPRTR